MDFILRKIDDFFKSFGWEVKHPGKVVLCIRHVIAIPVYIALAGKFVLIILYVIAIPVYIALVAPLLVPLAAVLGGVFWAIPLSVLEHDRYNEDKLAEETVGFAVWVVFLFVVSLALTMMVALPLALISVHWGRPSGMAIGIACALIAWISFFGLRQFADERAAAETEETV